MTGIGERALMPEAEVTLRLAFWLLDHCGAGSHADIAIDGAHVKIAGHNAAGKWIDDKVIFGIEQFLLDAQCVQQEPVRDWRGRYARQNRTFAIRSVQGFDIEIDASGRRIRAECKGGPLERMQGRGTTTILAQAIGQIVACGTVSPGDELWVGVPDTKGFENAARRIARGHVFVKTGIKIALVNRTGEVRLVD